MAERDRTTCPGQQFATLQLGAIVATGPLATVHRGSLGGRAVAVKQARAGVPGAAAALRREVRVLRSASHPALAPVLDVFDGVHANVEPTMVLGWADGGSLADLLADGPLSNDDVLHLLEPLAGALDALHRAGVAHLDVSTRNVLLAATGPLLIDPASPGAGTPCFTDPFVAAGGPASQRSDVFGLAACAHAALTGRLPRAGGGTAPGSLASERVVAVLAAGLSPDPRCRPGSATAFVEGLATALAPEGNHPAKPGRRPQPGRPVQRERQAAPGPAHTWPFERWQEELDAAAARTKVTAALLVAPKKRRRGARSSVPDDPRRPPDARPPPSTTLEAAHDTTMSHLSLSWRPWQRTRAGG